MRHATPFLCALALLVGLVPQASAQCFQTSSGFSAELLIDGANSDGSYTYVWDVIYASNSLWITNLWFQTTGSTTESVTVQPDYSTWTYSQVAAAPGTSAPALRFVYQSGFKLQKNRGFTFAYTADFQDPVRVTARTSTGSLIDLNFTSSTCGNLPVELTAFDVKADAGAALVTWQTASETNNAGFSIEARRTDDAVYTSLGYVAGKGTTLEAQDYSFRATGLEPGRYVFRLKQIDFDGAENFSAPFELELASDDVVFVRPFANPVRGTATLSLVAQRAERMQVDVFNALGQRVDTLFDGVVGQGERVEAAFDATALPAGLYLVRIGGESFQRTLRVVVAN